MVAHRKRFQRWRSKLGPNARYLVDRVLGEMVPEFERRCFHWYPDYAGDDPKEIAGNTIPLQRREAAEWPTVHLQFGPRGQPRFSLYFASLPPICRRLGEHRVPRERAIVVYAPAYFMLCKGKQRSFDGQFGYRCWSVRPRHRSSAPFFL